MTADIIDISAHRPARLGWVSSDPVLRATANLPRTADLETRLQTLIAAGATDRQLEIYTRGFLSARAEA